MCLFLYFQLVICETSVNGLIIFLNSKASLADLIIVSACMFFLWFSIHRFIPSSLIALEKFM